MEATKRNGSPGGILYDPGTPEHFNYYHYQANYLRNSRAIGVLWAVFTMCYAIINFVVFVQPQWLGDTETSKGTGYFGLWKSCRLLQDGQDLICEGRLDDISSIPTPAFRAATVFVGLSVVIITLCLCSFVLFFFLHSSTVFHICGWLQAFNSMCMLAGVLIFPAGWDAPIIKEVCGRAADNYVAGQCGIRWAYILAMIGVVDCAVLSILAFILGTRYVKMLPDQYLNTSGSVYKGEVNNGFIADNGSRKSMNLQPVMLMPNNMPIPDPERYSEYSTKTGRSHKSMQQLTMPSPTSFHPAAFSVNNFQL
ncbi:LHFPL tetraspan subfamily member 3 protein [Tetranychus urticae]|uniref:LHFPL tetraspan subfamily member 3 protein n=1 Tax=Tetranychus urticae TaxID=32264 RepID=UPI00077B96B7|nr:LHFPL tetraspan subfamily member 3 protein [Tetranychus urticae]